MDELKWERQRTITEHAGKEGQYYAGNKILKNST
jgi:hypothetical protein